MTHHFLSECVVEHWVVNAKHHLRIDWLKFSTPKQAGDDSVEFVLLRLVCASN